MKKVSITLIVSVLTLSGIVSALTLSGCGISARKTETSYSKNHSESNSESSSTSSDILADEDDDEDNDASQVHKDGKAVKEIGEFQKMVKITDGDKKNFDDSTKSVEGKCDLDLDGTKDVIKLEKTAETSVNDEGKTLNNNENKITIGDASETINGMLSPSIWVTTLDGDSIYVCVCGYDSYAPNDQQVVFFQYKDKKVVTQGVFDIYNFTEDYTKKYDPAFVDKIRITKNGSLTGIINYDEEPIQKSHLLLKYKANQSGELELQKKETYNFAEKNNIKLNQELNVYDNMVSKNTKTIKAQDIKLVKLQETRYVTTKDSNGTEEKTCTERWFYIKAEDGTDGWLMYSTDEKNQAQGKLIDGEGKEINANDYFTSSIKNN